MSSTRLDTLIIVDVVHVGELCDSPLYMEQLYSQQLYMVLYIHCHVQHVPATCYGL